MTVHFSSWPSSLARPDSDLHINTVLSDKKWVESGWNWTCLTFMFPRLALINYKLEIISQLRWDYLKWKEFSREHLTHVTWRTFWQWGHWKRSSEVIDDFLWIFEQVVNCKWQWVLGNNSQEIGPSDYFLDKNQEIIKWVQLQSANWNDLFLEWLSKHTIYRSNCYES